jgi:CMP-N,N'-diacetyllegionaminic acid synthase
MRSGSQGLKGKNIKLINGKPLMYFTIKQAIKSKIFDNIVVSTDTKKVLVRAKSYGAEGWFIRPKRLASNTCSKILVIKHTLREAEKFYNKKFKFIVDLDVTSPLRKVEDIINAYKTFIKNKGDVLITGTKSKKNPYFNVVERVNNKVKKVKKLKKKIFRRQDAPVTYDMNASIYIYRRKILINSKINSKTVIEALEHGSKDKAILYEMPASRSIDIDSEYDFRLVEFLLKNKKLTSKI